jgi:TATA-binding protein-associated factor Taf7
MESILTIDLKNNQDLLEDFDGISPGDLIKVSACYKVSELSENRLSAPLDEVYTISLKESESDEDDDDEEEEDEEDSSSAESY